MDTPAGATCQLPPVSALLVWPGPGDLRRDNLAASEPGLGPSLALVLLSGLASLTSIRHPPLISFPDSGYDHCTVATRDTEADCITESGSEEPAAIKAPSL